VTEFFMPMEPPTVTHHDKMINFKMKKIYDSPRLKQARLKLLAHLVQYKPAEPYDGAVRLTTKWLFRVPEDDERHGQYRTSKPDTDNLQKLLKDCMTTVGFWEDDAQVASEIIEKLWTGEVPGIYIKIEEV
jgi:Holliday junction resolvase RusA-like endonuclease